MDKLHGSIRRLLKETHRKRDIREVKTKLFEHLEKELNAIVNRFQEVRDSYYYSPSGMIVDLLGIYESLYEIIERLRKRILNNPALQFTQDERECLEKVEDFLHEAHLPYYGLYDTYYWDEPDEIYSLSSLREDVDRTCERINEAISILSALKEGRTEDSLKEQELKKEIRRLLWDSFMSARMKTLRKQEETKREETPALERAVETVISQTIDDLEKIKSRLERWNTDKEIIQALNDIIGALKSRLL